METEYERDETEPGGGRGGVNGTGEGGVGGHAPLRAAGSGER